MEYKTFFILVKLIINASVPFYIIKLEKNYLLWHTLTLVPLTLALFYISIKKKIYRDKYVFKVFIPSLKLVIFIQACDCLTLVLFYYKMYSLLHNIVSLRITAIVHGILSLVVYILILFQKNRTRKIISSAKHTFKLGIIINNIGEKGKGLSKDQPVEIIGEYGDKCKVYDGKQFFEIDKKDLEYI